MRVMLSLLIALFLVGTASAAVHPSLTNHQPAQHKGYGDGTVHQPLSGGESFADATVIPGLPYTDSGATCGMVNDITPCCASSNAPDAFYSYTPSATGLIDVSLCGSNFDTILGIYDRAGNCLDCNDDFCGVASEIDRFAVTAGQTYYLVVDGYGTSCGSYTISVTDYVCCDLVCPEGAQHENEPDCHDGYVDTYDGGCNGPVGAQNWLPICPSAGSEAVLCGKSGTYLYNGMSYRDSDWFRVFGNGAAMTETCTAEFPLLMIFIYGTNCSSPQYEYAMGLPGQTVSLSRVVGVGTEAWMWVGPSVFSGVPCGSNYVLSMSGIWCAGTATEVKTWGTVKSLYR